MHPRLHSTHRPVARPGEYRDIMEEKSHTIERISLSFKLDMSAVDTTTETANTDRAIVASALDVYVYV